MGQKSGKNSKTSNRVNSSRQGRFDEIENFILIWLDQNINQSNKDIRKSINHLRRIVNSIKIFTHSEQCVEYLSTVENEKVFLIVSGSLGEEIVPRIGSLSQLTWIYIFCNDQSKHEQWTEQCRKIQGVFTEIEPLCEQLKHDVRQGESDLIPMSIIPSSFPTNLNELDQSFMYSELLKEILVESEYNQKDKKELVDFCRRHYAQNKKELEVIDEFKRNYVGTESIWWYTRQCFLFPMLNKALRTQDVEVLIKMGFVVRDIHRQLEQMHSQLNNNRSMIVYRGQGMIQRDFEKMKKSQGGLLSFNNFLSTSTDRHISFQFASDARDNLEMTAILFRMEIDPSMTKTPFASLNKISFYGDEEKEILFSMHTVFRIGQIKQIKERFWQVDLKSTSDNDQQLTLLTQHIRQTIRGPTGLQRMAQLLIKMAQYDKAEEIYLTLLQTTSNDNRKQVAHLHHQLGFINDEKADYNHALSHYQQSLNISLSYLSSDDPSLAPTYSNIGAVYKQKGQLEKALLHFERALTINLHASQPDQLNIATDYNNIGGVLKEQNKFNDALRNYQRALQIELVHLPSRHPSLAITYNNIAGVYYSLRDHSSALDYYEKTLEIQQKSLPPNHPSQAITHNNLAHALDALRRTREAIRHAERAVDIDRYSLASNHPQLQRHQRNLEELRRIN